MSMRRRVILGSQLSFPSSAMACTTFILVFLCVLGAGPVQHASAALTISARSAVVGMATVVFPCPASAGTPIGVNITYSTRTGLVSSCNVGPPYGPSSLVVVNDGDDKGVVRYTGRLPDVNYLGRANLFTVVCYDQAGESNPASIVVYFSNRERCFSVNTENFPGLAVDLDCNEEQQDLGTFDFYGVTGISCSVNRPVLFSMSSDCRRLIWNGTPTTATSLQVVVSFTRGSASQKVTITVNDTDDDTCT